MAGVQATIRTFIAPVKGSGRSPPAFLQDLTLYDPWQSNPPEFNLLRDSPLKFVHGQCLRDLIPSSSCRHVFYLKPKQSQVPLQDERPGPDTIWIVAAFCSRCRSHLHLKADFRSRLEHGNTPCPNADRPLHHLVFSKWQDDLQKDLWSRSHPDSQDQIFTYECSSRTCSAIVTVRLSRPVLNQDDIHTLVDKDLLRQRTEEAFQTKEGNTEGMKHPLPIEVLTDLRAYIRNAWREEPRFRSINLSNRRFIVRFGPGGSACKDVLENLGFRLKPGECWQVPEPDLKESPPLEHPVNLFLDNVEHELNALIVSRPSEERQQAQDNTTLMPAERELARALGCQDYDTIASSRTSPFPPEMRTAPYTGLGIPMDIADELVVDYYRWQLDTDSGNAPLYLSFLRQIAAERQSEMLETELVLERSRGRFDTEALNEAYDYFGLRQHEGPMDDDYILGVFSSRLEDARAHEHEMREYLRMIGVHRNSQKIIDTAENLLNTYDQALRFLDAEPTQEDEHIQALFAVKVNDNEALREQAVKAVQLIAQHRKSRFLSDWIDRGFSNELQMDAAEGYQALQINNRQIDDDLIIAQYDIAVLENPQSVDYYNRALAAIATGRNSTALLDHLHSRVPQPQGAVDEPVGLENIGNTCYLNSLLQFLFTITELRRIVLDFDSYKMSLDPASMLGKRVGQRKVSLKEVQTAQKFVENLASLFRGMIETPQSSIRPEQELARLTLETEGVKERMRRKSTMRSDRPSLGQIDDRPILGPVQLSDYPTIDGPAVPMAVAADIVSAPGNSLDGTMASALQTGNSSGGEQERSDTETLGLSDNSSEATLVSRPGSDSSPPANLSMDDDHRPGVVHDEEENLSSAQADAPTKPSDVDDRQTDAVARLSLSKAKAPAGALANGTESRGAELQEGQMVYQPPPGKPPPVPPRKPVEATKSTLEEYARQQDVTEVIGHCLFQFSCAIRPTGFDKTGEQLDEVHDLFFGQTIKHALQEKESQSPVQFLNIITRIIHQPVDIYAALDSEFDLQSAEDGSKTFLSVAQLPPVLSIALDRASWNNDTKRQEKLNHHVDVPETIFMDRYLESSPDSEQLQRREQTWNIKAELSALSARRKLLEEKHASGGLSSFDFPSSMSANLGEQAQSQDVPTLLEDAKCALEHLQAEVPENSLGGNLDINPNLIATLGLLAEEARTELDAIRMRMDHLHQQIKEAFVDMRKHPYRLHAAFFHRGTAGAGHYFVYIYDHKKEIWRQYNDDRVRTVHNRNEIFGRPSQDQWGPPPNPYLLVYVQADRIDELVETVKRDIVYPPPDEPPPLLPARNQMSEMPPGSHGAADTEMTEILVQGIGGEQTQIVPVEYAESESEHIEDALLLPEPLVKKEGTWDDSELMVDRRIGW